MSLSTHTCIFYILQLKTDHPLSSFEQDKKIDLKTPYNFHGTCNDIQKYNWLTANQDPCCLPKMLTDPIKFQFHHLLLNSQLNAIYMKILYYRKLLNSMKMIKTAFINSSEERYVKMNTFKSRANVQTQDSFKVYLDTMIHIIFMSMHI